MGNIKRGKMEKKKIKNSEKQEFGAVSIQWGNYAVLIG